MGVAAKLSATQHAAPSPLPPHVHKLDHHHRLGDRQSSVVRDVLTAAAEAAASLTAMSSLFATCGLVMALSVERQSIIVSTRNDL